MKHRSELLRWIWIVALGVILGVSSIFPGILDYYRYKFVSVGLAWGGAIVVILGIFGIAVTIINEYLDKGTRRQTEKKE